MNKLMGTKWFTFYTKVRPISQSPVRMFFERDTV